MKFSTWIVLGLALAAFAAPALADETQARPAFRFDAENQPLGEVMKQAAAAKKLIFIDFFLEG